MKTLNENSTAIFFALLQKMEGKQHLKIENEPFMPLTIEYIGDEYNGQAQLYSLCHYYQKNGGLMQDPEICFLVIDSRVNEGDALVKFHIIPYSYKQADMGINDVSIRFENGTSYPDHELQEEHAEFADIWLNNIKDQGFLK